MSDLGQCEDSAPKSCWNLSLHCVALLTSGFLHSVFGFCMIVKENKHGEAARGLRSRTGSGTPHFCLCPSAKLGHMVTTNCTKGWKISFCAFRRKMNLFFLHTYYHLFHIISSFMFSVWWKTFLSWYLRVYLVTHLLRPFLLKVLFSYLTIWLGTDVYTVFRCLMISNS